VSTVLTRPAVGTPRAAPAAPAPRAASTGPSPTQLARTDLLAMSSTMIPFGIALGVTVASLRIGDGASAAGAVLMYAGAAQLSATTMLSNGAAFVAVVLSGVIVNSVCCSTGLPWSRPSGTSRGGSAGSGSTSSSTGPSSRPWGGLH
jgi:hypothetical protein